MRAPARKGSMPSHVLRAFTTWRRSATQPLVPIWLRRRCAAARWALVLYVDMVARRCRVAPLPKLLSLKDQVAATAASLASISLDAPLAACGVDPPFPQDTAWCSPHRTASMDVERVFARGAVADAAEHLSDYSTGDSRGDDLDDLSPGVAYKALRLHYKLIISGFQGVAL